MNYIIHMTVAKDTIIEVLRNNAIITHLRIIGRFSISGCEDIGSQKYSICYTSFFYGHDKCGKYWPEGIGMVFAI